MLQTPIQKTTVEKYLRLPRTTRREFWSEWKIEHIRELATMGKASTSPFLPDTERGSRVLDRLSLLKGARDNESPASTVTSFCRGSNLRLNAPLYLGDMSFGSLSGTPNVALAMAADRSGVIAGTGEGGLHTDVAKCRNITVQWASARFGVDLDVLKKGAAVVIKIGQGAKPGIGGHLPGIKVTGPISQTRRIPMGMDAISPAPHHDIYSIEDLGQRIESLKAATRKPVFVKVAATNYIPYVASGIARMGAAGIIIDGAGAGTGAAPTAIKDNVGLPIELAVASTDEVLRREGLREEFTIVAAGRVSHPEDSVKLMALGADMTSLGTAALLALGCLMVKKCHLGYCPAALTNRIDEDQVKTLSLDWSVRLLASFVSGWTQEMRDLMEFCGVSDLKELVGNRSLLVGRDLNFETSSIVGLSCSLPGNGVGVHGGIIERWSCTRASKDWRPSTVTHLREKAGVSGKSAGETHISSMGNSSPPFVEVPDRISDFLVSDGAQVTRPSIDPYREEIETETFIDSGRLRLSLPLYFSPLPSGTERELGNAVATVSSRMGLLFDPGENAAVLPVNINRRTMSICTTLSGPLDNIRELFGAQSLLSIVSKGIDSLILKCASSYSDMNRIRDNAGRLLEAGISSVIVDEDIPSADIPLELAIALLDRALIDCGLRGRFSLLAQGQFIREAGDVFKLVALGADAVGLSRAAVVALLPETGPEGCVSRDVLIERLENLVSGLAKEIKLLAGAAGISDISSSLTSNRELLRSVDIDPEIRRKLAVKPAGSF